MRPNLLTALAIIAFASLAAHAQESLPLSRTVFKLSPQHFTQNALKAGVERFNKDHSSSFAFFLTGRLENSEKIYYNGGQYNGLGGEVQLRKYISPMREHTSKKNNVYQQGVYGAAYVQGGSYSGEFYSSYSAYDPNTGTYIPVSGESRESIGNWGLGFTIGYQKTMWQVVFLEVFIGGGIQFCDRNRSGFKPEEYYFDRNDITDPGYKGILPKIGLNIGIGL